VFEVQMVSFDPVPNTTMRGLPPVFGV
jgi:hypothetical protein